MWRCLLKFVYRMTWFVFSPRRLPMFRKHRWWGWSRYKIWHTPLPVNSCSRQHFIWIVIEKLWYIWRNVTFFGWHWRHINDRCLFALALTLSFCKNIPTCYEISTLFQLAVLSLSLSPCVCEYIYVYPCFSHSISNHFTTHLIRNFLYFAISTYSKIILYKCMRLKKNPF